MEFAELGLRKETRGSNGVFLVARQ